MEPRVGVAVFIMEYDKFVMLERQGSHGAGTWSIPGGAMEFGEHWFATAVRELKEEVGMYPYSLQYLTITNDIMYDQHWVTIWLIAQARGQQPRNLESHKAKQVTWQSFDNLPQPLFGPWQQLFDTVEYQSWDIS